jgi:hypothetical protein
MLKSILVLLTIFYCIEINAQESIVLKKKGRNIQYFWKDSHITFQLKDKQWLTGIITKITPDSFYLTQEIIRYYMMGIDTLHISGFSFAFSDVYALPTKKQMIYFENDQVKIIAGHEKFVWIRNGFIFQAAGAGYIALNVTNDLIHNEPPFAKKKLTGLGIGAAVFLMGKLLQLRFDPYWHVGKKYKLQYMSYR